MIDISIEKMPPEFCAGEIISGRVEWIDLDTTVTSLETRLIWYTEGKGDQDVEVVVTIPAKLTAPNGNLPFEFVAPNRPFSFSGKLISLIWAFEVVLLPGREGERKQITISGDGSEVVLDRSFQDSALREAARISS